MTAHFQKATKSVKIKTNVKLLSHTPKFHLRFWYLEKTHWPCQSKSLVSVVRDVHLQCIRPWHKRLYSILLYFKQSKHLPTHNTTSTPPTLSLIHQTYCKTPCWRQPSELHAVLTTSMLLLIIFYMSFNSKNARHKV